MSPWSVFSSKSKPQYSSQPPTNLNDVSNVISQPSCGEIRLSLSASEATHSDDNAQTVTGVTVVGVIHFLRHPSFVILLTSIDHSTVCVLRHRDQYSNQFGYF